MPRFYDVLLWFYVAMAALSAAALLFINAPYGRYAAGRTANWGPAIRSSTGWVLMEAPAVLVFLACFAFGDRPLSDPVSLAYLLLWQSHYVYRAFIYPLRVTGGDKPMPLLVAVLGLLHNVLNGYLNGRYLFSSQIGGPQRQAAWLVSAPFLCGAALFFVGMAINHHADHVLRGLRRPGETGYKVPYGGLYRFVSCPNYLGEMIEWLGWALCTLSPAGLAFALYTAANLVPRARAHHRFYQERFADYPRERRALVPFLF